MNKMMNLQDVFLNQKRKNPGDHYSDEWFSV